MSSTDGKIKENLDKGFKDNIESLQKVNLTLGKISESQKNIDNLNTQIVKLNTVFSNNQIRGKFGEIQLEKILQAIFGEARNIYDFQYEMDLKDRKVRPDAVIHLDDEDKTILCIDSKFSFYKNGNKLTHTVRLFPKKINALSTFWPRSILLIFQTLF